ncbi:nephrocystin-4 isoform X2 [Anolis carolinensis]|uniref:nephrocystin-4 isoform X2 n=1 Tax=Anolis carolinensis TaxID=28377 RepID=UPI002F2B3343
MGEWQRIFARHRAVPPHHQRRRHHVPRESTAFQCVLKRVEGDVLRQRTLGNAAEMEFQLRLSLFDAAYHHFFGKTWRSDTQPLKAVAGQPPTVTFNETVYFHTPLAHPGIVLVVEVVVMARRRDGSPQDLSCGFGLLPLFSSTSEPSELDSKEKGLGLYHGTPRALLHPLIQEPLAKNKFLVLMEGSRVHCHLQLHPPLEAAYHLLPENVPVSAWQGIPGVVASHEGDPLQKPRLLKTTTCYLENLSIHLYPSLEKFEEELLELLMADQGQAAQEGRPLCVRERRLHLGVHSGLCFAQTPQVAVLVPEDEVARRSRRRTGPSGKGSSEGQALVLRSRIHLTEMVRHPAFAVVFLLEYVFSATGGSNLKACSSSSSSSATSLTTPSYMHAVRWAAWSPSALEAAGAVDVVLPLHGGARHNPSHVLVYKTPPAGRSSEEVKQVESGSVQFRFSVGSSEKRLAKEETPTPPSLRKAVNPGSPPSPPMLVSTRDDSRGPGLSVSQLTASPSRLASKPPLQPSVSSETLRPAAQESAITHLESDLSRSSLVAQEASSVDHLQEMPFTPVQVPIIALGMPSRSSSTVLTRAALARLRASGFPQLLDCNKEPVQIAEPTDPVMYDPQTEEADLLQSNEIVLQFLAFTRIPQGPAAAETRPESAYFTFQFYRFPPVTTPRLQLVKPDSSRAASPGASTHLLVQINQDGTLNLGSPGFQLRYMVDPGFLKAGEQQWFLRYLSQHSLHIDAWDGDSLLLLGSTAVKMKHLLRRGRTAVQVHHELEVLAMEYKQDATVASGDAFQHGSVKPIGVEASVRGRLHLSLANIGHLCEQRLRKSPALPASRSRVVSSHDGTSGFHGGSLLSLNTPAAGNVCQAQKLADMDSELAAMLFSRLREASAAFQHSSREASATRRRKMERMLSVRRRESQEGGGGRKKASLILGRHEDRVQHSRDLQLIEAYRERIKAESIAGMLSHAITSRHTLYATFGTAQFFEFALKNPYNVQHTVTIESDSPELSVIVDTREWKHFKELTQTVTPLEEEMFHLQDHLAPQVYLRPKETVHVPFKYQAFCVDSAAVMQQGPAELTFCEGQKDTSAGSWKPSGSQTKHIKVSFTANGGKPLALLRVSVEPQPHIVDQTFRFYHPELTFLKKSIRLAPWHTLPGAPVGMPGREPEVFVRCSDPNIICETKKMGPGEPQDVFLKVAGGPSPQIKQFFVAIYTDPWLAAPTQIWQFYLHSLQRVDVSCVTGQLTRLSLLLRGTQSLRKVQAYSSHLQEMKVDPEGAFILPANGVQDLHLGIRPHVAGNRFIYLNLVDVEYHQLVSSWLLCLSCRQPLISKAFEIALPAGGGKGSNKRITYANPYPSRRIYFLHTNRPDLLQFKEDSFEIGGGETYTIGLRFAPSQSSGQEEILIYINDREDKNEEAFCVKVTYQ